MSYQIFFRYDPVEKCDIPRCPNGISVVVRTEGVAQKLCSGHFDKWVGEKLIQEPISKELDEVIFEEPKGEQLYPDMHVHGCCHQWDTHRNYMIAVASTTGFLVKQDDYLHTPDRSARQNKTCCSWNTTPFFLLKNLIVVLMMELLLLKQQWAQHGIDSSQLKKLGMKVKLWVKKNTSCLSLLVMTSLKKF